MTHDPLCPYKPFIAARINGKPVDYRNWGSDIMNPPRPIQYAESCQCKLIRAVRLDQSRNVKALPLPVD